MSLRGLGRVVGGALTGLGGGMVKDVEARREAALRAAELEFRASEGEKTRAQQQEQFGKSYSLQQDQLAAQKENNKQDHEFKIKQLEAQKTQAAATLAASKDYNQERLDLLKTQAEAQKAGTAALEEQRKADAAKKEIETGESISNLKSAREAWVKAITETGTPQATIKRVEAELSKAQLKTAEYWRKKGRDDVADTYDPDGQTRKKGLGAQESDADRYGAPAAQPSPQAEQPPAGAPPGLKKAPDGKWYAPDPNSRSGWSEWTPD